MFLSRFIILQSVVTRYLFVQKVVNGCCYYRNVEKNIVENDTLTDLPEDIASERDCPELCYLEDEIRLQLYQALNQLPELQQTFIRLHFFYGYSYQQIAQKYHLQKSTICGYIKRGLRNLKILLTDDNLAS